MQVISIFDSSPLILSFSYFVLVPNSKEEERSHILSNSLIYYWFSVLISYHIPLHSELVDQGRAPSISRICITSCIITSANRLMTLAPQSPLFKQSKCNNIDLAQFQCYWCVYSHSLNHKIYTITIILFQQYPCIRTVVIYKTCILINSILHHWQIFTSRLQ